MALGTTAVASFADFILRGDPPLLYSNLNLF